MNVDSGSEKIRGENFNQFIDLLKNMSAIVIQMIETDYFASNDRVELVQSVFELVSSKIKWPKDTTSLRQALEFLI